MKIQKLQNKLKKQLFFFFTVNFFFCLSAYGYSISQQDQNIIRQAVITHFTPVFQKIIDNHAVIDKSDPVAVRSFIQGAQSSFFQSTLYNIQSAAQNHQKRTLPLCKQRMEVVFSTSEETISNSKMNQYIKDCAESENKKFASSLIKDIPTILSKSAQDTLKDEQAITQLVQQIKQNK